MKKKMALGLSGDAASKYEDSGMCSYCLMSLEALQPGGRNPRHKNTHTPYLKCPQAVKALDSKRK